jgi:DNA (cytosine-5)-methyltransferase 1
VLVKVLDLFSGIGGFSLGLERAGMSTVAFCEINPFCRRVLAKHWPNVPIHEDIKRLEPERGSADLICGGFPCQPFSTASRGRKVAEDLWPEMRRIISEVRPVWVVAENVPGIDDEYPAVELEKLDFTVWSIALDAAPRQRRHARAREVFVAHANSNGEPRCPFDEEVAGTQSLPGRSWQDDACPLGMDDGFSNRMDRLGSLGNSFSPIVAEGIGRAIMQVHTYQ